MCWFRQDELRCRSLIAANQFRGFFGVKIFTFDSCSVHFCGSSISATATRSAPDYYDTIFKPVKWRSIGPFRGGRSVAGTGVVGDPKTYYMGTTGGGLWKTENMGVSWQNISDGYFKTGSVGAIAVAESDPNVVYVGMGEHAVRGVMTHHGDGVYKSTDAGKTWKRMGLESSGELFFYDQSHGSVFLG